MYKSIYLCAAQLIASGEKDYSCNAVMVLLPEANRLYNSIMSPDKGKLVVDDIIEAVHNKDARNNFCSWSATCPDCRNFRMLLLCMMAACVEDMV